MAPPTPPLAAAQSLLGSDLLEPLGGAAAALALLGMLLLLPLHITQRREISRLLDWQEREPRAGDAGRPVGAASISTPTSAAGAKPAPGFAGARPMTAAERVTSERPALTRIGTSERAALAPQPFWRRVLDRGPRHPLVLSLLALLVAAGIFVAAALLLRAEPEEAGSGGGADRASVDVVVVNASSSAGLAGKVADKVESSGYTVTGTGAAGAGSKQSVIRYARGAKGEAKSVARGLGIAIIQPFDAEAEAAANGADVVVIAGEDRAKATDGQS